jgi:NADPH:quinone reductase-like Zn-dependent oxidoreductase
MDLDRGRRGDDAEGLTTQYLFRRTTPIGKGDTVLFHAAAGVSA